MIISNKIITSTLVIKRTNLATPTSFLTKININLILHYYIYIYYFTILLYCFTIPSIPFYYIQIDWYVILHIIGTVTTEGQKQNSEVTSWKHFIVMSLFDYNNYYLHLFLLVDDSCSSRLRVDKHKNKT